MEVKNLNFSYGTHKILNDISFKVAKGKITTLIGANGCGKTTLLHLMTKNLKTQSGHVFLEGKDINGIRLKEFSQKVSIVQQNNVAPPDITVEKLIAYGRIPYASLGRRDKKEDERLVQWAMETTDVLPFRDRAMCQLSGGQKQRAWIALALAQNTKILFLDEPTTFLDIRYQMEILHLIQMLNREYGITIIMILHDMNQAIRFSDEIIGMRDGELVVQGHPEDVISRESMRKIYDVDLQVELVAQQKMVLIP